ncbi:transcription initiation factor IIB [Irineochytrium annulatum]|nr:transcription initiation factor IIB [Irineochytrium annulatum]
MVVSPLAQVQSYHLAWAEIGPLTPVEPPRRNLNIRLMCKDCRNPVPNIVEDMRQGDLICGDCGLVLSERLIDTSAEWRSFSDDTGHNPIRVGDASPDPNTLIATFIRPGKSNKPADRDLLRTHARTIESRAVATYWPELEAAAGRLGVANARAVLNVAREVMGKLSAPPNANATKGVSKRTRLEPVGVRVATSLYLGCSRNNLARVYKEIFPACAGIAGGAITKRSVNKCHGRALALMGWKVDAAAGCDGGNGKGAALEGLVGRIVEALDAGQALRRWGGVVCGRAAGVLEGRTGITVAAASVYFAAYFTGQKIAAREVATAAGCAEGTLRTAYKILYKSREALIQGLGMPGSLDLLPTY